MEITSETQKTRLTGSNLKLSSNSPRWLICRNIVLVRTTQSCRHEGLWWAYPPKQSTKHPQIEI